MRVGKNIQYYLGLVAILFLMGHLPLLAQPGEANHPELRWFTFKTDHFIVHYHQGTERTARKVAQIAEEVYPYITALYQYEPAEPVEFVIRDTDDYSNGGAYFYDNKIEIFSTNLDYVLRGTHDWLHDVVTHEFTHIISLQSALKFGRHVPAAWFQIFGYEKVRRPDVARGFPNVLVSYPISGVTIPGWFAEGVAQFQSPKKHYDYRDAQREMILRDRVLDNRLLSFTQMGFFGKNSIGNESVYNQGYSFVQFLAASFGDSVLRKLTRAASNPFVLNFDQALRKVTGFSARQLYQKWQELLAEDYATRLQTVYQHLQEGEVLKGASGIGNFFPTLSPDGRQLAYVSTQENPYLSRNALVVRDLSTGKETVITRRVSSSLSWSPDGRYLVYAKQTHEQPTGSHFNDLFVFDLKTRKELQLTNGLRASNPDWSPNGNTLVCVVQSDGVTNLVTLNISTVLNEWDKSPWQRGAYHLTEHRIQVAQKDARFNPLEYRTFTWRGAQLTQVTHFTDGRQFYHPRWAPDGKRIITDTSLGYGRDIVWIHPDNGELQPVLVSHADERSPVFVPGQPNKIIFASDRSGIFNLYELNLTTRQQQPLTNVLGGAFMPAISADGTLYYSYYRHQRFSIYTLRQPAPLAAEALTYDPKWAFHIPRLNPVNVKPTVPADARPYRRHFPGMMFMPTLQIDYGTIKPGLYFGSTEIVNKLDFFGGFSVNRLREYDIFMLFNLRLWKPTLSFSLYNIARKVFEDFKDPFYVSNDQFEITFNLLAADAALSGRLFQQVDYQLMYSYLLYRAKIDPILVTELSTGRSQVLPTFRYTYLKGHVLSLGLRYEKRPQGLLADINPTNGYYLGIRFSQEWNQYLTDFALDRFIGLEVFKPVNYFRISVDAERYFRGLWKSHGVDVRLQGGWTSRDTDSFFYFFAGGMVGLKGYPYYSLEGRQMAIATATYRVPLFRNLDRQVGHMVFRHLYAGVFYQAGNAWSRGKISEIPFYTTVGIQLRLDTYSWYFLPTKFFVEAAYPLQEVQYQDITYPKEWRFYFGALFDFNLRFEHSGRRFR